MSERGAALRGQLKQLMHEVAKYGAVGGAGVLVNLGVFNLVRATTEIPVVRASIIANVVAIAFNYLGFRYFTYRDRDRSRRTREMSLFLFFSAIGTVIENGVLYAATYGFNWDSPLQSNFFKFFGIGVATLFRFWSYRTWVFRAVPDPALVVTNTAAASSAPAASSGSPSAAPPVAQEPVRRAAEPLLEPVRPPTTDHQFAPRH
ncbi:GtrA family protein [Streptomyces sp. NPDC047315]|uniref:GtrA family protein n=1 Tax=Streptomyces sp. NPDC047315 TaxID=3155142 RepID=UPI0033E2DC43